ncbi:hypothetical protein M5689_006554 [Euphorbia peplus]|nr:hypothetical protein M5689_006554 [Euphorbia peplus]
MVGTLNLRVHHGGKFSTVPPLTYDGGEITNYRNISKPLLSYSNLVDISKEVGHGKDVKIYYLIPGFTLDTGADLIPYYNEESVRKMVDVSHGDSYLDLYFQEQDQEQDMSKVLVRIHPLLSKEWRGIQWQRYISY